MFKINVSKMKKIASDEHSTTLRHPDGHEFKVAHKPLSPDVLKTVKAIPLAEGGNVENPEVQQNPNAEQEEGLQPYNPLDTVQDVATMVGMNVKKGMDDNTNLFYTDRDQWIKDQAQNAVMGTMGGRGEAWPVQKGGGAFEEKVAADKAVTDAARLNKGQNASAVNNMDKGVRDAVDVHREIQPKLQHKAEGGEVDFEQNATPVPQTTPDFTTAAPTDSAPQTTPGEQLVQDKMNHLLSVNPNFYSSFPAEKLRDLAQNQVLNEQTVVANNKAAQDNAAKDQMQKQANDVASYNAQAQALGLPTKDAPVNPATAAEQPAQVPNPTALPPTEQPQQTDPSSTGAGPNIMQGYQQQMAGAKSMANAEGALGAKQAGLYDESAQASADINAHYQEQLKSLETERQAFIKDVQDNRINPDKYWDNHGKLAAGLGIILAGFTPAGGPNQALGFLNDQVNRSIQAQAKNLDSAHNLLAANLHQFGNIREATAMTRIMMGDVIQHYLNKNIAEAQSPIAKARAQSLQGQIQTSLAPEFMRLSMMRTMAALQNVPGGIEKALPFLRVYAPDMAKEQESRLIPDVGSATVPVPEAARNTIISKQQLDDRAKDLYAWASKHSGSLDPATASVGHTKAAELQSMYRNAINGGVFKKGEQEYIDNIVDSDPTKFFNSIRVLPKLKEVINSNQHQLNTLKSGYGIPVQQAPAEPQYKTVNGVKYMRGPDGKAVEVK